MARSTLDSAEAPPGAFDFETIEDRIASILTAIEGEKIPDRLLRLANELQNELVLRRQSKNPN